MADADDTVVTEQEETSLIDLITQGEVETDEVVEEIDTDTDDIEVLKERISKRNKALRKSKQANHRIQDEKTAMQERLDRLELMISQAQSPDNGAKEQEEMKLLEQWKESAKDDPSAAIDYQNLQMQNLQKNLSAMFADFRSEIDGIKGSTNPERIKLESEISALRADPDFEGFNDDQLMKLAGKFKKTKVPRPPIGGQRVAVQADPEQELKEFRERYKDHFKNGM